MSKKKKGLSLTNDFWCDVATNSMGYMEYYKRLTEMAITVYEWENLPSSVDPRFLELCLFYHGYCIYFNDEVMGDLALRGTIGGGLSVYNIPKVRTAIAPNGYQRRLTDKDSVIIFNNYLHTPSSILTMDYAMRLWKIDQIIETNLNAQRTPILITCPEGQRNTMEKMYDTYKDGKPVIYGSKELEKLNSIKAFNTGAPYLVDKLQQAKANIWNEALTYIGIPNSVEQKKERMLVDEVHRLQGGVFANQQSGLTARKQACDQINLMFKPEKSVSVKIRDDYIMGVDGNEQVHNAG